MKNYINQRLLFFSLLLCCSSLLAYGQFPEGSKTIGGGISYRSEKQENPSGSDRRGRNFFLDLSGGYMLQENLEIGANLGLSAQYSRSDNAFGQDTKNTSTVFSIGPYLRAYNPITDVVGLFGEAGMELGIGGGESAGVDTRVRTFSVGIRPGVILMVNENLGLETTIGYIGYNRYASGRAEDFADSRLVNKTFEARFDLSTIRFGFRLYMTN